MAIRPTEDEWMSLKDLADMLVMSVDTLYNQRYLGVDFPPTYQLNKKTVRLRRSEVDAWLEKRRQIPAAAQLAEQLE